MIHNFITQALEKEAEVHKNTKKKGQVCYHFPQVLCKLSDMLCNTSFLLLLQS